MPIYLEQVSHPSDQDNIDLQKLYLDYPFDIDWPGLKAILDQSPALVLYAARFNDRLIAAVSVRQDSREAVLDHLCTRAITRQRNVAKEMLRQLLNTLEVDRIHFTDCTGSEAVEKLFIGAGFEKDGQDYHYLP